MELFSREITRVILLTLICCSAVIRGFPMHHSEFDDAFMDENQYTGRDKVFQRLPEDIVYKIADPSSGLTGRDLANLYQAQTRLVNPIQPRHQFFYQFVQPHLKLNANASPHRVSASLYRCGVLLGDKLSTRWWNSRIKHVGEPFRTAARMALAKSLHLNFEDMTEADFIYECAQGLLSLVRDGVFNQVQKIDEAFKLQFVYQHLDTPGLYDRLMKLFDFQSNAMRFTLSYNKHCSDLASVLQLHGAMSDISHKVTQLFSTQSPMVNAGCIKYLSQIAENILKPGNKAFDRRSEVLDRLRQLNQAQRQILNQYAILAEQFSDAWTVKKSPVPPKILGGFIEQGLQVNIVSYKSPNMFSSSSYWPIAKDFLQAGLDIDRESFERVASPVADINPLVNLPHRVIWALNHGSSADRVYGTASKTILGTICLVKRVEDFLKMRELARTFVKYGADTSCFELRPPSWYSLEIQQFLSIS